MRVCSGLKRSGEPCTVGVEAGQTYCHHHDPARAAQRSWAASRAARSKPNRELDDMKRELRSVVSDVRSGKLARSQAVVAIQAFHALTRVIELQTKIKEAEEMAARIATLEDALEELGRTPGFYPGGSSPLTPWRAN
jgi:hypothetical protein